MRLFRAFSVALFLSSVAGQSILTLLTDIPECAIQCIDPSVSGLTCQLSTVPAFASCLCPNTDALKRITACFVDQLRTCDFDKLLGALDLAKDLCHDYPKESRQSEIVTTAIVLLSITILFVLLRWLARWTVTQRLWWDDYTLGAASVILVSNLAILICISQLGFGRHLFNVDGANFIPILKMFYYIQIAYVFAQVLTKVSLLLFLLRIFPQRWFRVAVKLILAFVILHGFVFVLIVVFQCMPVHAFWDRWVEGKCLNAQAFTYAGAGFSIVEDFLILMLPLPCLKSLNMRIGQKLGLVVMFSVGSLACITSILRLSHLTHYGGLADATWDNVGAGIWSAIENSCAVICACLPTLRPLVAWMFPQFFGTLYQMSYQPHTNDTAGKENQVRMEVLVSTEIEQRLEDMKSPASMDSRSDAEAAWSPNSAVESSVTGHGK